MIIYISNQNNHGIGHTKKPLHVRTREMLKIIFPKTIIWWEKWWQIWLNYKILQRFMGLSERV